MRLTLVIGSPNISSWSFRAWLVLRRAGAVCDEVVITLQRPDSAERIARWSPSGKVPVLLVDDRPVWDSLAIAELAAEAEPSLWPHDPLDRAHARSVSAEMHSGFADLRAFMPMDFLARFSPPGRLLSRVARDISRIETLWTDCRCRYGEAGPFLFGRFTVADAMFAPVVSRFVTYGVELGPQAAGYTQVMQQLAEWREWAAACRPADADTPLAAAEVARELVLTGSA
jgi:glutathione S-transferase